MAIEKLKINYKIQK